MPDPHPPPPHLHTHLVTQHGCKPAFCQTLFRQDYLLPIFPFDFGCLWVWVCVTYSQGVKLKGCCLGTEWVLAKFLPFVRLNSSGASHTSKSGGCSILSALQVQAVLGFWEKTLIHRVYSVSSWPRLWLHTSQISDRNTLQFTLTQLQLLSHLPFVSVHQLELWGVFCSHFVNLNKSLWMMWSCHFWYCSVSCHMTQKAFDWFTRSWLISSSGWVPWGNYFTAPCN